MNTNKHKSEDDSVPAQVCSGTVPIGTRRWLECEDGSLSLVCIRVHSWLILWSFNSVDNTTPAPTVTAPKSCRAHSRFYETHLPAIQANTETAARLSCADADEGRPRDPRTTPATRPKTSAPKRRRETLRSSYSGLIIRDSKSYLATLTELTVNRGMRWPLRISYGFRNPQVIWEDASTRWFASWSAGW